MRSHGQIKFTKQCSRRQGDWKKDAQPAQIESAQFSKSAPARLNLEKPPYRLRRLLLFEPSVPKTHGIQENESKEPDTIHQAERSAVWESKAYERIEIQMCDIEE